MKYFLCFSLAVVFCTASAQKNSKRYTIKEADSLFTIQQWVAAIPAYEYVLKSTPDNALAWNRLGFSYHNTGNYDKAMTAYQLSLTKKPTPAVEQVVHSRMAKIFSLRNENSKSVGSIEKAMASGYMNVNELRTHNDFSNLRKDPSFEKIVRRATENAMPCLSSQQARQFDFWIGEWDAYVTGTTSPAGHSRIDRASGGCMILENWTSLGATPFEGRSMNFVDPATNKWKQVWVGSNGTNVTEFLNGEYRDGAMRFEFETTDAQQRKQFVHFYFFNEGPDQVRQLHETSIDDGKTWIPTYDFTYRRRKS
jgi:hypothetical protein